MKTKESSLDILEKSLNDNKFSHWFTFILIILISSFLFNLSFNYGVSVIGVLLFVVAFFLLFYGILLRVLNWQAKKILMRKRENERGF